MNEHEIKEKLLYVFNEANLYKVKYIEHLISCGFIEEIGLIEEISRELIAENLSIPEAIEMKNELEK